MTQEQEQLKKRLTELARRAYARGCYVTTDFLNLAEQDVLAHLRLDGACAPYVLEGGYEGAERKIACFGSEALCGYVNQPPIACLCIAPVSQKFSDALAHRDFLGALMSLGIRRELLGDILVADNCGYLFCEESICEYLIRQLEQIRHTTVRCSRASAPACCVTPPPQTAVNVASTRLDAVVAAVFHLSRSDSSRLFLQEKVFVNSRLARSGDATLTDGAIVSVRGLGRFVFDGVARQTRKGRLQVLVRKYGG